MSRKRWTDLGQIISGVLVVIGIGIEVVMRAHLGFIFITLGGFSWGLFTKLKGH